MVFGGRWLLPPVFINLFLGLAAGASRMGLIPVFASNAVQNHGAVMMMGFISGIIVAERANTLKDPFLTAASIAFPAGGFLLVAGIDFAAYFAWFFGSLLFVIWSAIFLAKYRSRYSGFFFLFSSLLNLLGIYFYAFGYSATFYVYSWVGFIVSFICGERMDMLQISRPSRLSRLAAYVSPAAAAAGVILVGKELMALFFLLLLLAVARHDLAIRMFRRPGFSRFLSIGIITAYAWLGVAALVWALTFSWDTMLHTIFLGFVGTMILAHGPVVLPAILKIKHFFTPLLYIPFTILQASTVLRIVSGVFIRLDAWAYSGLITIIAVAIYVFLAFSNTFLSKNFLKNPSIS